MHRNLNEIKFYTLGSPFLLREFLGNSMGKYKPGVARGKEHFIFLTMKSHIKAILNCIKSGSNSIRET